MKIFNKSESEQDIFLEIKCVRALSAKKGERKMFEGRKIFLGIAPIGWTNDDMPQLGGENTFEQCVSEAALAGFQGTEVGGKYPTNPQALKRAMELRGLKIASQWFSSFLCTDTYEENERAFVKQLDFLEAVGANRINVCELTRCLFASEESMFGAAKPIATDEEWEKLSTGLDKLGKIATEHGFKLCYHHHMATVVQTVAETRRLMETTDPKFVYLCFDTGHFTFAGEDAVAACKEFAPRIGHVHLKDIRKDKMEQAGREGFKFRRAVLENCFTVPGDGFVDFPGVFKILDKIGYEGWLLVEAEQDPAVSNPFEYAVKARKYIREVTGI